MFSRIVKWTAILALSATASLIVAPLAGIVVMSVAASHAVIGGDE